MLNARGIACAVAMVIVPVQHGVVIHGARGPAALQTAAAPVEGPLSPTARQRSTPRELMRREYSRKAASSPAMIALVIAMSRPMTRPPSVST